MSAPIPLRIGPGDNVVRVGSHLGWTERTARVSADTGMRRMSRGEFGGVARLGPTLPGISETADYAGAQGYSRGVAA
ncbi:hypothetical protein NRB20_25550 [Nocardia sp. RB20]|uniref:Uncharacterized protein n=1 Tax=Nocardia macrotermitis TaxID=2585198 RepID=A0A7K0D159_9NOCA|nr:hypothetical protein [Nocardia macrotermitis]